MSNPANVSPVITGQKCPGCGYDLTGLAERKCPECGLGFDEAAWREYQRKIRRRKLWISIVIVFVAYYTPYLWLLLIDYPWNEHRWTWIKMWPALPLLIPATLSIHSFLGVDVDEAPAIWILSATCLVLLAGLIWFASRRTRWVFILIVAIVAALSTLNSWVLYHGFLM